MRQRHTFCRAVAGGESFRAVARKYGVSEKTVRKWYRRWVGGRRSFHALMNSRPGPRTTRARADVEALVAELFPRFKGVRLRREMAKRGVHAPISTIYRAIHRLKLAKPRKRKPRLEPRKMELPFGYIQCDTLYLSGLAGPVQYTAIEAHTRLRFIRVYNGMSIFNSLDFLSRCFRFFPFTTLIWSTDGGSEFSSAATPWVFNKSLFTQALEYGGKEHRIFVGKPHLNGRVERSHRADREEFYEILQERFRSEQQGDRWTEEAVRQVPERCRYWNEEREHQALGWRTPKQALEEILGRPVELDYSLCL
ncbi:integrase core domain-containing protein [Calidithermus terrae]|nr:integrase core domain-containing protein [Calidithermus terrae]